MSRHLISKKNFIKPNLAYESIFIQRIKNKIIRKGKKELAQKLLSQTIHQIEHKTSQNPIQIIEQAIQNVTPSVEIKARRIGGAVYSIPLELSAERGTSIAVKWIISSCRNRSGKSFVSKLSNELIDASKKMGNSIRKKEEVYKIAESNSRLV